MNDKSKFIARCGGREQGTMQPITRATRGVEQAADFVQDRGMELVAPANNDFAWIHPRSAGGVLIQIVQDSRA